MNWTAIAVTGLISATTTLIVMWLAYELVLKPRLQCRAEVLADELEARVRAGVLSAGEELLPKFRQQVTAGFKDALLTAARGEHVEESVRAMARSGADLLEEGLGALLGRKR